METLGREGGSRKTNITKKNSTLLVSSINTLLTFLQVKTSLLFTSNDTITLMLLYLSDRSSLKPFVGSFFVIKNVLSHHWLHSLHREEGSVLKVGRVHHNFLDLKVDCQHNFSWRLLAFIKWGSELRTNVS